MNPSNRHVRFNLTAAVGPRELTKLLKGHSAEDIRDAETLLVNAKIDVNDFFASGNGKDEFQELLFNACTPVEFGIQGLPEDASEEERNHQLEPVLAEIAAHSPLEQSRLLKLVQERLGKAVPMATLKEQVRSVQQNRRNIAKKEKKKAKRLSGSPPGSCRARVDEVLIDTIWNKNVFHPVKSYAVILFYEKISLLT